MSELNLIKTVLFNAANLNEALTRLTELGIQYRACSFTDNGFHVTGHDVTFWPTQSLRCPLAVCIDGNLFDYDDRRSFLAGQCETVETPVPAASPETTGQRPFENFREPADRFDYDAAERSWESHSNSLSTVRPKVPFPKIPLVDVLRIREIVRTERRLKRSQAKGLSS